MKISDMMSELEFFRTTVGDVEVLITDGVRGYHYRGNFNFRRYDEDGETYVDIGIGYCLEDENGIL